MVKRVGPAQLTLVENGEAAVVIRVRISPNNEWRGVAVFPIEMIDDAALRISIVETPNDLEDLIREFSDEETWGSYQEFRNFNGF